MTPDWQLPPGIDRGLWDYIRNDYLAERYDEALTGTPLLDVDLQFSRSWFDRPGRLVDLGCGTGRLLVPFAARGFDCVGVDLSEGMLAVARGKIERAGLKVELNKCNIVELDALPTGAFDYAACLFSTLGMVRGVDNRKRVLEQVRRLVRPGGRFVLHVHNRWFHSWNPLASGDWTAPQLHGGAALTLHHFTGREIRSCLAETGFRVLKFEPISTGASGRLRASWLLPSLRAYGFLIAAE